MHRKPLAIQFRKRTYDQHGGSIKSTDKSAGTREVTEHSCVPKDQDTVQCNEVKFVFRKNEPPNETSTITSVACMYVLVVRIDVWIQNRHFLLCLVVPDPAERSNESRDFFPIPPYLRRYLIYSPTSQLNFP